MKSEPLIVAPGANTEVDGMGASALRCGGCGYDATGLPGNTCPECGKPVIDHGAREAAAALIEDFRDGRITNDNLEDRWLRTTDPTVRRCFSDVWCCYSDTREYRLTGKDAAGVEVGGVLTRWALFRRSGEVCDDAWNPRRNPGVLMMLVLWLVGAFLPLVCLVFGRTFEAVTGLNRFVLVLVSLGCFAVLYSVEWLPRLVGRVRWRLSGRPATPQPLFPFKSEEAVRAMRRTNRPGSE